jgi:hypothetical protein
MANIFEIFQPQDHSTRSDPELISDGIPQISNESKEDLRRSEREIRCNIESTMQQRTSRRSFIAGALAMTGLVAADYYRMGGGSLPSGEIDLKSQQQYSSLPKDWVTMLSEQEIPEKERIEAPGFPYFDVMNFFIHLDDLNDYVRTHKLDEAGWMIMYGDSNTSQTVLATLGDGEESEHGIILDGANKKLFRVNLHPTNSPVKLSYFEKSSDIQMNQEIGVHRVITPTISNGNSGKSVFFDDPKKAGYTQAIEADLNYFDFLYTENSRPRVAVRRPDSEFGEVIKPSEGNKEANIIDMSSLSFNSEDVWKDEFIFRIGQHFYLNQLNPPGSKSLYTAEQIAEVSSDVLPEQARKIQNLLDNEIISKSLSKQVKNPLTDELLSIQGGETPTVCEWIFDPKSYDEDRTYSADFNQRPDHIAGGFLLLLSRVPRELMGHIHALEEIATSEMSQDTQGNSYTSALYNPEVSEQAAAKYALKMTYDLFTENLRNSPRAIIQNLKSLELGLGMVGNLYSEFPPKSFDIFTGNP